VLSGRGLCDELITRPDESCRLWCVIMCDLETSRMRRPWPALGRNATEKIITRHWKLWTWFLTLLFWLLSEFKIMISETKHGQKSSHDFYITIS